jgi:DnaK suppressor protein
VSKTSAKSPDTDKPDASRKAAATAADASAPASKPPKSAAAPRSGKPAATRPGDKPGDADEAVVATAQAAPVTGAAPAPNRFSDRFSPPKPPARGFPEPMETVKPAVKADPKLVNAWKSKAGRDLTEAELMAMPESEYMNDKQLDFFRARLQALKDDLLSNAGETTEHLREDTSIVPDPADRATIEEEHALELRTRDRERKLLKKISQSLGRIEAGDYGYCDETGEPIGLGRLLARPTATLSLEAQQRRELKQKMFGD